MPIKAITFDFWSTLYRPSAVDYKQRQQFLKATIERYSQQQVEGEQFKAAVGMARDIWHRAWVQEHRTIGAAEWLTTILTELDISLEAEAFGRVEIFLEDGIMQHRPTLVAEAHQVLAELAKEYRLALISDSGVTPGRVLRQIMEEDEAAAYFQHLTFSDEIGRSKPHPEAFTKTLDILGVAPAEAVHVGDLLRTDIVGAQGVGMRGVQYVGVSRDGWAEQAVTPDAVINNHQGLMALLSAW